jgi:hypothetical protein
MKERVLISRLLQHLQREKVHSLPVSKDPESADHSLSRSLQHGIITHHAYLMYHQCCTVLSDQVGPKRLLYICNTYKVSVVSPNN